LGYRSEEDLALGVGLLSEDERLATADNLAATNLAGTALELESNLLGSLGLLAENRLGLSTESGLLGIVAAITLSASGGTSLLVLGDLVDLMLLALHAICVFLLRSVHLKIVRHCGRDRHESIDCWSHDNRER
jgi:hypothetical protein